MLYCKRNGLIPHFPRPKFAVKINKYFCDKIGRQILDVEIRNKYRRKKRLLQQVKNNTDSLKIGLITKLVPYRKVKLIIEKEEAKSSNTHKKKLDRLQPEKGQFDKPKRCVIENIIHNFSSYKLSSSEEYALSFGLDQHIPDKFNKNKIQTKN